MQTLPEVFETAPVVYAVRDRYVIIVPVKEETLMWVKIGDEEFYDESNGILRSATVTHKIEGKHAEIGAELARKYGMDERIVHAIAAHHDDIEPTTPEAVIVKICDAVSAARPGARNVSAENFAERMRGLENIATSFQGIEKAYAISAGREVRVIVEPKTVDDLTALKLARDIANKIEATMQYPGVVKVNVIRETRAIEYAK